MGLKPPPFPELPDNVTDAEREAWKKAYLECLQSGLNRTQASMEWSAVFIGGLVAFMLLMAFLMLVHL